MEDPVQYSASFIESGGAESYNLDDFGSKSPYPKQNAKN